jgi:exo-beta-1,3-glucanase (GH17 family)
MNKLRIELIVASLIIPLLILAGNVSNGRKNNSLKSIDQSQISIQQHPQDLLAGVSKAICYSGFRTGQHPDRGDGAKNPTDEQILEDLQILTNANYSLIRLYDSGENSATVLRLIDEHNINMKVMLGIWLNAELSNHETCAWLTEPIPQKTLDKNKMVNAEEIKKGIELANKFKNIVVAVNVGNETLVDWNDHRVDVDTLISYVRKVKKAIKQPVTVAENYEWWAAHGVKLANELDFIAIHIYPVWEGKDIDKGISYSIENVQKVRNALPDARIIISEAGWATVASEFGERASEEKQKQYYDWIMQWSAEMNITTFFFEAFDEDWKGDTNNPMGAEKHWGLYNVDRTAKKAILPCPPTPSR